jgi:hypothetical protein
MSRWLGVLQPSMDMRRRDYECMKGVPEIVPLNKYEEL